MHRQKKTVHYTFAQKSEYDLKHDFDKSQNTESFQNLVLVDFGHTHVIVHLSSPFFDFFGSGRLALYL